MYATLDGLSSLEVVAVALVIVGVALWSRARAGAVVREAGDDGQPMPRGKRIRRVASVVLFVVIVIAVSGVGWVQSYNPLAQSWSSVKGEFSSYVASAEGVEAHETSSLVPYQPVTELVTGIRPSSGFSVQVETEVENNGSRAVRIVLIGEPEFCYKVDDYRFYFYRYRSLGSEAGARFRPFTLNGHSARMVVVTYSQPCESIAKRQRGRGRVHQLGFEHHCARDVESPGDLLLLWLRSHGRRPSDAVCSPVASRLLTEHRSLSANFTQRLVGYSVDR